LRNNYHLTLSAVKNWLPLKFVPEILKNNQKIIESAVLCNPRELSLVSDRLKDDYRFVMKMSKCGIEILSMISKRLKNNNHIIFKIFKTSTKDRMYINPKTRKDLFESAKLEDKKLEIYFNESYDKSDLIVFQYLKSRMSSKSFLNPVIYDIRFFYNKSFVF
jgi:hypothetical protein